MSKGVPNVLQKLSVQDVKGLLGVNLPNLKGAENDPSVAMWIKRQFQSDLDTLGIGLRGGMTSLSSTAMNASIATSPNDAPTTGIPITTLATSIFNATTSSGATWLIPGIPTDATSVSKITTVVEETSLSVVPTTKTVPVIDAIPKVDFPTENPTVSSIITATSKDTNSVTPALPTSGDVTNTTTTSQPVADSNSTTITAITMDSTVAFTSEITTTSFNVTVTSNDTFGEVPIPVTATDTETTSFDESGIDFNTATSNITALPPSTVDFTTEVPVNITASSNDTLGSILVLHPTTDTNGSTSVETTASSNTTVTTNWMSLPPTITDSNVTTDTNATFSPTPAMPNMTTNSSKRPPAPTGPMPNAITLTSIGTTSKIKDNTTASQDTTMAAMTTRRVSSKVPLKTRPPSRPTPNGYINVKPVPGKYLYPCTSPAPQLAVPWGGPESPHTSVGTACTAP
ncbi:hypothetical protein JD844_019520 [Phrynosoma platyrhinos]|uniref:Uncharacterized protein n=1 Tax=Phrynosoma platyrhinos TaxID=52577 RepID=A0ABQ7TPM7_PHRPL|nr:hypothetical protein JD844_019520 [Phrynosoma platyrhinos]